MCIIKCTICAYFATLYYTVIQYYVAARPPQILCRSPAPRSPRATTNVRPALIGQQTIVHTIILHYSIVHYTIIVHAIILHYSIRVHRIKYAYYDITLHYSILYQCIYVCYISISVDISITLYKCIYFYISVHMSIILYYKYITLNINIDRLDDKCPPSAHRTTRITKLY